ncbi:Elongator complex protein 6 [Trichoplax sp. H2]|nr:Elongator complex protein 6 [Trichoplax sp. H2]|eukprot:RDD39533.1 Elongator complex protein 6 [Trichoplax sp. H2]
MFPELNSLLECNKKNLPNGKSLVIIDSQTDGSFLLHHFISLYIQGGGKVVMLAFAQSFSHYSLVAQKLGINLNSACDDKTFVFLPGLKYTLDGIINRDVENPLLDTSNCKSLHSLYQAINSAISANENQSLPTLLIIDDISTLLYLGFQHTEICTFLTYCQHTICKKTNGCILSLIHNDSDVEDQSSNLLSRWFHHFADIVLELEGLQSGRSKDVHGQLKVVFTRREQNDLHSLSPLSRCVHYRIRDKGVSFFALGTSPAIL